jgi:hypothetical protein
MEVAMTRQNQSVRETESNALSAAELEQVSAGIIAVLQPKLCDGSVRPVAPQTEKALIGLL